MACIGHHFGILVSTCLRDVGLPTTFFCYLPVPLASNSWSLTFSHLPLYPGPACSLPAPSSALNHHSPQHSRWFQLVKKESKNALLSDYLRTFPEGLHFKNIILLNPNKSLTWGFHHHDQKKKYPEGKDVSKLL